MFLLWLLQTVCLFLKLRSEAENYIGSCKIFWFWPTGLQTVWEVRAETELCSREHQRNCHSCPKWSLCTSGHKQKLVFFLQNTDIDLLNIWPVGMQRGAMEQIGPCAPHSPNLKSLWVPFEAIIISLGPKLRPVLPIQVSSIFNHSPSDSPAPLAIQLRAAAKYESPSQKESRVQSIPLPQCVILDVQTDISILKPPKMIFQRVQMAFHTVHTHRKETKAVSSSASLYIAKFRTSSFLT